MQVYHIHLLSRDGFRALSRVPSRPVVPRSPRRGNRELSRFGHPPAFDWRTSLPKNHNDDNGWIENNILLFIALIQLAWIIPTLLIVLLVKAHVRRQEERRTLSLTEVADELNLDFQAAGDSDLTAELSGFPLFNHGRAKKLKNLINADTQELRIGIFDYQFTFGHGKRQRTRRLTAAVVRSSDLDLPASHLRPKRAVLDTLGSLFGRQDINFKHHPRFSESFVLKSDNEELIREFFDQELLEFFANNPNISFELQPGAFLFFSTMEAGGCPNRLNSRFPRRGLRGTTGLDGTRDKALNPSLLNKWIW